MLLLSGYNEKVYKRNSWEELMGRSTISLDEAMNLENGFSKIRKKKRDRRNGSEAHNAWEFGFKGENVTDIESKGNLVRVWAPKTEIDKDVARTLKSLALYPGVYPYVAIMPDFHIGESSVNGAVIPSENMLYVNAIGGDLGCGMSFVDLGVSVDSVRRKLNEIYGEIYEAVPTGKRFNVQFDERLEKNELFVQDLPLLNRTNKKLAMQQFGSLGRGNHFIELQEGEQGQLGLMIHTGSRGIGHLIRNIGMKAGTALDSPRGLVVIEANSEEGEEYLRNINFAVQYASKNRLEILMRVLGVLQGKSEELGRKSLEEVRENVIDVPHNLITQERHFGKDLYVHRKGAVNLLKGQLGIIPGSMGTHSYVVVGRGNVYSFNSCSHGAGRIMSRGKALNTVSPRDFESSMSGIVSRRDRSVYDEAPQAYKNIELVLGYQKDLVKRVSKWYPTLSIKG